MSARQLKKLGGRSLEDELKRLDIDVDEEKQKTPVEEESEEDDEPVNKSSFNAFAYLNGDDDEEDDDENKNEVDDAEEDKEKGELEATNNSKVEKNSAPSITIPSKKSKKKKKKSKTTKKSPEPVDTHDGIEEEDNDDELDRILAEVKAKESKSKKSNSQQTNINFEEEYDLTTDPIEFYDSNFKNFTTNALKKSLPLLSINSFKNLDPDQEYKNLFGNSLSIELIEDANSTTSLAISPEVLAQFKKLGKMIRNWGGKDRRNVPGTSRKLLLSKIRDDWLPTQLKSVTMEELSEQKIVELYQYKEQDVDEEDIIKKVSNEMELGVKYFKFNKVTDTKSRIANTKFYASTVLTPDPDSLMQLLQQHPYHQETLLQVAMVLLRQGDNKATSNALIERALFTFDRSFHRVFHELISSAQNGLIRLPYEFFANRQFYLNLFRYIVSLGERSLFFTAFTYCKFLLSLSPAEDPMGVRYFIDFYCIMSEEYEYLIELSKSPLVTSYTRWYTPGIAYSTVLAYLKLAKQEQAIEELKKAYEAYPFVAFKLLTEVGLSNESRLKDSDFKPDHEILVASETYLIRAKLLWQPYIEFLSSNLEKLFATRPKKTKGSSGFTQSIFGFLNLNKSTESSKPEEVPLNLIRFAILSGENKIMAKLPTNLWNRDDILEYDVLPPSEQTQQNLITDNLTNQTSNICDSLINYVDQGLLGDIVQQNTTHTLQEGLSPEEAARVEELMRRAFAERDEIMARDAREIFGEGE
ncbi:uncharacterized protein KGF55_001487 [Candida pseudojiufengensis]|uniref:uncharacterized protein n=1 Tax=Candida pseudojiufengensis TaxID=497109 RepID=UPI002224D029|nr:uncharacterized protein KGF55_001487 [Candida pseudojiufengensis]KAI5965267.1 hypothetical protein KGF55_001487 [Candida pseudojiufengensis]